MESLRIKICGVTTEADACAAARLGASAIGLNFYASSPRHVDPAAVPAILRALPAFVEPVGVFVNLRLRKACALAHQAGMIRVVQWHGENHELCDAFPFRFIPAFPVSDASHLLTIARYLDACRGLGQLPAAVLVDAKVTGQYGGTGRQAPWNLIADFKPGVPLILAGGLSPENVAEAVRIVRPYAVDVASGVESQPGRKDVEKMRRFIENARAAAEK